MNKCQAIGKTTKKPCPWNAQKGKTYCKVHESLESKEKIDEKSINDKGKREKFWNKTSFKIASFYFFCIPLFALFYSFIPRDFYHSTAKYEKDYITHIDSLSKQLVKEAKYFGNFPNEILRDTHKLKRKHSKFIFYNEVIETDCELEWVSNYRALDNKIVFDLKIKVKQTFKKEHTVNGRIKTKSYFDEFYIYPTISCDLLWNKSLSSSGSPFRLRKMVLDTFQGNYPLDIPYENYFVFNIDKFNNDNFIELNEVKIDFKELVFIQLENSFTEESYAFYRTKDTYKKLLSTFNTLEGFPIEIEGNFSRFLYLSASTITTLGLGDIYPLTSFARILITLETIIGVLLIGLFLNAIAMEN